MGKKSGGKAPRTADTRSGLSGRRRILLQELAERVRRLSALGLPVFEARAVEIQHAFIRGMKSADVFEVTAITGVAMIGNDDTEKRSLFGAVAGKANVNSHTILDYYVKARTNRTLAPGGPAASGAEAQTLKSLKHPLTVKRAGT